MELSRRKRGLLGESLTAARPLFKIAENCGRKVPSLDKNDELKGNCTTERCILAHFDDGIQELSTTDPKCDLHLGARCWRGLLGGPVVVIREL